MIKKKRKLQKILIFINNFCFCVILMIWMTFLMTWMVMFFLNKNILNLKNKDENRAFISNIKANMLTRWV